MMVFDSFSNDIHISWCITSNAKASNMAIWLNAKNEKIKKLDLEWKPEAFIVDNVDAKINVTGKFSVFYNSTGQFICSFTISIFFI